MIAGAAVRTRQTSKHPATLSLPDSTHQSGRHFNFCPSYHRARLLRRTVLMDGGRVPAVTSASVCCTHGLHKGTNPVVILDALALFHPATDIHGIGPYPGDGIGDVVDRQATGQDNRLAQILWYQRPVKCLTSSARHTFNIGIEQNTAGPCIRLAGAGDVITSLDPQALI